MLEFTIDQAKCTKCGMCAADCPMRIIALENGGLPAIKAEKAGSCMKCLHCFAVCPTGALSILGHRPEDAVKLAGNLPEAEKLETLMRGRRSVRRFLDENVDPQVIRRLLDVAANAPTGVNARKVRFTVIDDRETMKKFRHVAMEALEQAVATQNLGDSAEFFAGMVRLWKEKGVDVPFRGAPHLVVTSTPKDSPTPEADGIITLAYFELFAADLGLGCVWDGIANWIVSGLAPRLRSVLGIPDDHTIGYFMAFGKPAVKYPRAVIRKAENIAFVKL